MKNFNYVCGEFKQQKEMKTRIEKIEDFLSNLQTDVDVLDYVDVENVGDFDDIYSQIDQNGGFDIEIIYYSNAIKYLMENDASLQESMEIASEYGFTPENLNSEVLASLLASRNTRDEFSELAGEIDLFFSELDDEDL